MQIGIVQLETKRGQILTNSESPCPPPGNPLYPTTPFRFSVNKDLVAGEKWNEFSAHDAARKLFVMTATSGAGGAVV